MLAEILAAATLITCEYAELNKENAKTQRRKKEAQRTSLSDSITGKEG